MGHVNEIEYLNRLALTPRRVLEIGSRQVGSTQPFREMFAGSEYVGLDIEAGEGVDLVADLMEPIALEPSTVDLVICCSVLEHVRRPWVAAENIATLMRPGGLIYLAVPWCWRFHPYPGDYWRFSWQGVAEIFPMLAWSDFTFSTSAAGEFFPAKVGEDDQRAGSKDGRKYLPYLELHGLGRKPLEALKPAGIASGINSRAAWLEGRFSQAV